jgi:3-isopropylmalate/(R)-2-methylmalate dehydratase small subunit
MMEPFTKLKGIVTLLDLPNVDTDQIIPKQFLKRIERTGYGEFLFFDWRRTASGDPDQSFPLNDPRYKGAQILIAGKNFACGSSREHAAWAVEQIEDRLSLAKLDSHNSAVGYSFAEARRNLAVQRPW